MQGIKENIQNMVDRAKGHGLRVKVEHKRFDQNEGCRPVKISPNGRITFTNANKKNERGYKNTHSYARSARALTIVRLLDGRKIVSRGFSICGECDNFNKNIGTARALAQAVKQI